MLNKFFFMGGNTTAKSEQYIQSSGKFMSTVSGTRRGGLLTKDGRSFINSTTALNFDVNQPVRYIPETDVFDIVSMGVEHGLGLKDDNTLWSWGYNNFGRTGQGTSSNSTQTPTQVGSDTDWLQVSAGKTQSLFLKNDNTLWSCGWNETGATGLGTDVGNTVVPTQIGSDTDWVEISAGGNFCLAIKSNGTLWSWGNNENGRTGLGTDSGNTLTPTQIGSDTDWLSISTSLSSSGNTSPDCFSLALKTDGTLWSWGNNENGRTGLGTDSGNTLTPTQIGSDTDWDKIATGSEHALAIKSNGTLWSWGNNANGRTGLGTDSGNTLTPTQIGSDTDWFDISGGFSFTHATKSDGTLWYFGESQTTPEQIGIEDNWGHISIRWRNGITLKNNGTRWVYGLTNELFSLGVNFEGIFEGNYVELTSLGLNFIGFTKEFQAASDLWSLTSSGQIFNGNILDNSDTDWTSISSTNDFILALKENGTLWSQGSNANGRTGQGTTSGSTSDFTQIGTDTDWLQISAGFDHASAVKTDGTLWSWGNNEDGRTGQGFTSGNTLTPTQVGTDTNWKMVTCGNRFTFGVKQNGLTNSWGYNFSGQLGSGSISTRSTPGNVVGLPNNPTSIAIASSATLAIVNGILFGTGDLTGIVGPRNDFTPIGSDSDWLSIGGGTNFFIAIKQDGTAWSAGSNDSGVTGQSTNFGDTFSFTQITFTSDTFQRLFQRTN